MKGSLEGAGGGSGVPHGCALKSLWISAENWVCKRVVLLYIKMSGPHRVRFSLLDILIQCIRGFFQSCLLLRCLQNDEKEKKEMEENYSKEDELILNKQALTFVLLEMAISDSLKWKPLQ